MESFHGKLRDEFLNLSAFADLADAKAQAAGFQREYNTDRPHSGLGYRTPKAYAATCGPATTNPAASGIQPVLPPAGRA